MRQCTPCRGRRACSRGDRRWKSREPVTPWRGPSQEDNQGWQKPRKDVQSGGRAKGASKRSQDTTKPYLNQKDQTRSNQVEPGRKNKEAHLARLVHLHGDRAHSTAAQTGRRGGGKSRGGSDERRERDDLGGHGRFAESFKREEVFISFSITPFRLIHNIWYSIFYYPFFGIEFSKTSIKNETHREVGRREVLFKI